MLMDHLVIIPFGDEFLALTPAELAQARQRSQELLPASPAAASVASNEVLDARGMEQATGIPHSWFAEQARRGAIPHLRAGKYVRFRLNEVLDVLRHADSQSATVRKSPAAKRFSEACYQNATKVGSKTA